MKEEIDELIKSGTLDELVELPPGKSAVGCTWVLRKKRDAENKVVKHKSRLCAQGFSQTLGVDYHETAAPTVNKSSLRYILSLAAEHDLEIHQIDFKNAFLNGSLDEEIYMRQPPGFEALGKEGHVWRLKKALYGLKQAGLQWYKVAKALFEELGLVASDYDPCVFYSRDSENVAIVAIHVDDCILCTSTLALAITLKDRIARRFKISDLGEARWILGFEIIRDRNARTIAISQRAYIDQLLERFNMQDAMPVATPMALKVDYTKLKPSDDECADMKAILYAELVGGLNYLSTISRPDNQFATSILARFMADPTRAHWNAARHNLRYLKGTKDHALVLGATRDGLMPYSDCDWASESDRQSISGCTIIFNGAAIAWYSRKQSIVAMSTCEAEYIGQSEAARELMHITALMRQLPFSTTDSPPTLYCDNQSAIKLAETGKFSARTKHIDVKFRFVTKALEERLLRLAYTPTSEMVADALTKALPREQHEYFRFLLGVRPA
jgi:hypothetical protein